MHFKCLRPLSRTYCKFFTSKADIIQEGDRALLRYKDTAFLTKPLRPNGQTATCHGSISHDSIIGMQLRDLVTTSKGVKLRAHLPTLEEYVTLTPRIVTPIYPKYANLMVSLLDIHVSRQNFPTEGSPLLEILEAGTGHGGLTLYLARAIHAANSPHPERKDVVNSPREEEQPSVLSVSNTRMDESNLETHVMPASAIAGDREPQIEVTKEKWQRQAVIHSLEISPTHSRHAQNLIKGFRQGQYAYEVDFHIGEVSAWIEQRISLREQHAPETEDKAFLSHIILDLPKSYLHLEKAASVLHVNGNLLVFNPSITQIIACVKEIKSKMLPLELDRVLEVGYAMAAGREWDVRAVKPRALVRAEGGKEVNLDEVGMSTAGGSEEPLTEEEEDKGTRTNAEEVVEKRVKDEIGWEMVCRPKANERWSGGGFVGVWKKMRS